MRRVRGTSRASLLAHALLVAWFAGVATASDPLAPRFPWSEGGWSASNWLGFCLELGLFLLAAALIMRLGHRGDGPQLRARARMT